MRRKLIKQGIAGLTLYVPKKWTDKRSLKAGDEVEIAEVDGELVVSPTETKRAKRGISLKLSGGRKSALRTLIVNSYRNGYDSINLEYPGSQNDVQDIVTSYMLGFELMRYAEGKYIIESVAEPDYEDFDKIIQKMLFILINALENIEYLDVDAEVQRVQRYENFLKRAISKNKFVMHSPFLYWLLLSNLTQVGRFLHYLKKFMKKLKPKEKDLKKDVENMLKTFQKAYLKKDIEIASSIHSLEDNVIYEKGFKLIKSEDQVTVHYLLNIARLVTVLSGILVGIIESEMHN